ncbi:hypothetical protein MMC18_009462 [Xylographa bjoerkii]|nr:hypothetical protein [Xylographa bjoerkii]
MVRQGKSRFDPAAEHAEAVQDGHVVGAAGMEGDSAARGRGEGGSTSAGTPSGTTPSRTNPHKHNSRRSLSKTRPATLTTGGQHTAKAASTTTSAPILVNPSPFPSMATTTSPRSSNHPRYPASKGSPRSSKHALPPLSAFSFADILASIDMDVKAEIDGIAEICGRSKLSLANEYGSHLPPHGERLLGHNGDVQREELGGGEQRGLEVVEESAESSGHGSLEASASGEEGGGRGPRGWGRGTALASTIVPVFFESHEWASPTSFTLMDQTLTDVPDELRIPLPPSAAGSEYGDPDVPMPTETPQRLGDPLSVPEIGQETTQAQEIEHGGTEVTGNTPESPSAGEHAIPLVQASNPITSSSKAILHSLFQILREDAYESGRFENLQNQVQDLMSVCHVTERLISGQLRLYRMMLNCLKSDNSAAFASLYSQAIHIQESQIYPNYLPRKVYSNGYNPLAPFPGRPSSWLHNVSPEIQRGIVHVITRIRSDPNFLAGYLTNLSSSHLNKLAHPHRRAVATESVLRNPIGSRSVGGSASINSSKSKDESEPLGDVEHDPLFLLINCMFQTSDDPGSVESSLRCGAWSTVCARIIEEGKADSDEFCLVILDVLAGMGSWPMKPQLETFLTELIQSGIFVLEFPASQVVDFTKPTETSESSRVARITEFFDNALRTLTQLLTGGLAEYAIPKAVLDLIHATLSKIGDPAKRIKARRFFIRWYCTSYISNALIYPEGQSIGIMMEYHISKEIRQKIFHELAARFQRSVFDVLSPWKSMTTDAETASGDVEKLLGLFDPADPIDRTTVLHTMENPMTNGKQYLTLSMKDILVILNVLRPSNAPQLPLKGFFGGPIVSKASSITGSSTLTSGTDEPRTGTASSTAVSEGGTSMTSDGSSTQMYLGSLDDTCSNGPQHERYLVGQSSHEIDDSFLMDEHHMDAMIQELSRLIDSRDISTAVPNSCEEDFVALYIKDHGEALSLDMDPLDMELSDAKFSLEALAKNNLEPRLPSQDHLRYLVEGVVRISQTDGMLHDNDEDTATDCNDVLEAQFRKNMIHSESCYDYQAAHFWWSCIQVLGDLSSVPRELLFTDLATTCRIRIETSRKAIAHYEEWCAASQQRQMIYNQDLENLAIQCRGLRDKMWYSSGVKYSSTYQDSMNVTRALRSMAKSPQTKATGMAAWARQRLRSSIGSDRAQQQTLEVLAAPKEYGGPAKMSDEQVELTSRWLTRHSVENFCKGEERIHRFCLEIQKCVNKLVGESLLDSPVLWSSALYQHEKQQYGVGHGQPAIQPGSRYQSWKRNVSQGSLYTPIQSIPYIPDSSRDMLPNFRDNGMADSYYSGFSGRSPSNGPSNDLSDIVQSYNYSEGYRANLILPPSPLSPTFQTMHPLHSFDRPASTHKQQFLNRLKDKITSLLLSELGSMLWNDGSETDRWINERRIHGSPKLQSTPPSESVAPSAKVTQRPDQILSGESVETDQPPIATSKEVPIGVESDCGQVETSSGIQPPPLTKPAFTFHEAYRKLFKKLSLSTNPYDKLRSLYEITTLIAMSQEPDPIRNSRPVSHVSKDISPTNRTPLSPSIKALGIPRTRLTRLEEVMANCEERRLQSIKSSSVSTNTNTRSTWNSHSTYIPRADPNILPILQSMLLDPTLYSSTLFRDLQYIAAFVPSLTLDASPLGTAFWTFGLAAINLKSTLSAQTAHRANLIVAHHYSHQPLRENPTSAVEPRRPSLGDSPSLPTNLDDPSLSTTTLADAARLYTISALEGDPTAARELALFHLTHPELVRRVTLPFSRPAEVFRSVAAAVGGKQEGLARGGLDPMAFAVAFHWMEVAANAGDKDAKAFLRENGDLGRGW